MKTATTILAGLALLAGATAQAQQRPLSCQEARDRALTRVTIVSNSRVLMEEDLAALSVTLRYTRQRLTRLETELKALKTAAKEAPATPGETKATEPDPKAGEPETEAPDPETEGPEDGTPTAPTEVKAGVTQ